MLKCLEYNFIRSFVVQNFFKIHLILEKTNRYTPCILSYSTFIFLFLYNLEITKLKYFNLKFYYISAYFNYFIFYFYNIFNPSRGYLISNLFQSISYANLINFNIYLCPKTSPETNKLIQSTKCIYLQPIKLLLNLIIKTNLLSHLINYTLKLLTLNLAPNLTHYKYTSVYIFCQLSFNIYIFLNYFYMKITHA